MALLLIIIGLIVGVLLNWTVGILLVAIGIILLFVPAVPGGYNSWGGRRGP